jgi:hypothetical protein
MRFEILLEPYAIIDIQEAIAFYDTEHQGLGRKFENSLNRLFVGLEKYPFYAVRYDEVRCLPMRRFPFMIHFTVNEVSTQVIIRAVLHTSSNPERWNK